MSRLLALAVSLFTVVVSFAQTYPTHLTGTFKTNISSFSKGDPFVITSVGCGSPLAGKEVGTEYEDEIVRIKNERNYALLVNGKLCQPIAHAMNFDCKTPQEYWDAQTLVKVMPYLTKKGLDTEWFNDAEQDALEYIQDYAEPLRADDDYLEKYLYSLVTKIAPPILVDGRPCNVNLMVIKDPTFNALTFPNGTIVITTGLLTSLHSEDELVAVLSHEIAHCVLAHSYQNYRKEQARKKRAEFWAGVATAATAVGEGVLVAKGKLRENPSQSYYRYGDLTLSMAILAGSVAQQVVDRLGMKYNHDQEYEADAAAREVLTLLGYNPDALATALSRIVGEYNRNWSDVPYLASFTHPSLMERIEKCGKANLEARNQHYEQLVSFAVTTSAEMAYSARRFTRALQLVRQNITNGVGTPIDYLIAANALMNTADAPDTNQTALEYAEQAKALDGVSLWYYKTAVSAYMRVGRKSDALAALDEMVASLEKVMDLDRDYYGKQLNWAKRMRIKLKGMNG